MSFPWVDLAKGIDADVLRVGLGDLHRQREDERGRVDRGGLDDRLNDRPVREHRIARGVLLLLVVRPHDPHGKEVWMEAAAFGRCVSLSISCRVLHQ